MKYFILILFLFLFFSFKTSSFAKEDVFRVRAAPIVLLLRNLEQVDNIDVHMMLQKKGGSIVQGIQQLYVIFSPRITNKPTLDISKSYRLVLQKYPLSCEIAALSMVMENIKKKHISEEDIFSHISIFPEAMSATGVWSDPDKGFVGSYTGSQRMKTGYGIYPDPLLNYVKNQGVSGFILGATHGNDLLSPQQRLTRVLEIISSGDHVILWGDYCTTREFEDGMIDKIDKYILRFFPVSGRNICDRSEHERIFSWKTLDNKSITALSGEHTFILLGYLGSLINPTHIIVWDTSTGKHFYTTSEWMRKWGMMSYRALILKGTTLKR